MTGRTLDAPPVDAGLWRDAELDCLFAPQETGYLGADVALSIPLGGGRVLWLFGDTVMGSVVDGRRHVRCMPRNSAALVHMEGTDPRHVEWLPPREADFLEPHPPDSGRWFWPGTGFAYDDTLFILGYDVESGPGPYESLAFHVLGSRLLRFRGIDGPPESWSPESVPFITGSSSRLFCSASHVEGGFAHLLGFQFDSAQDVYKSSAVLGRVPLANLAGANPAEEFDVLGGPLEAPCWAAAPQSPVAIYRPGVSECSVYHDAPRGRYLATTYDSREGLLRVTSAPRLEGPWCDPAPVYRVPEFRGAERHHAYTFRMHPHLATSPDEMVFTYVVNGKSLAQIEGELDVYYPRFLRGDLRRIAQPSSD